MPSNVGLFPLKLYFYKQLLILKGATASLKNCGRIIWTKYQSSVDFKNSLFRIKQLMMLFAAQEVLYW